MPKFGTHILFAELAAGKRPDLFLGDPENARRLGAVGPDLTLFLFDPVESEVVRKGFAIAMDVLSEIRRIKNKLEKIAAIFDGPVKDLEDWVTGGLSTDLTAVLETAIEAMLLAAKLGVASQASGINIQNPLARLIATGQFDPALLIDPKHAAPVFVVDSLDNYGFPFRYFGHPYTDDGKWKSPEPPNDHRNFWWMDMLHYRRTGSFAKSLLAHAADPVTLAYARGYMTHVAGDICGHPFINAIVGGPFRNHAYRHMVLEGLADTWLWSNQKRGDIINAKLNDALDLSRGEFDSVADLIIRAMRDTYQDPVLPDLLPGRYPDVGELRAAYESMQLYLDLSTGGSVRRPKPPPDTPEEIFDELQDLLSRNRPGSPPRGGGNALDFIVAMLGYILRGVVFLAMLATLPIAVLTRFLAVAPRWVLYMIHLAIFMVVSGLRTLLAMMGWGYAGEEDLLNFGFLKELVTVSTDSFGAFPSKTIPSPKPPWYWLMPPRLLAVREEPATIPGPIPNGATPFWMIDPANVMDTHSGLVDKIVKAQNPSDTIALENAIKGLRSAGFGNAVDFSISLLSNSFPVPDLDLDGDRGYGYRGWTELPPNERYV